MNMDIENTPEFQEYWLKVDGVNWINKQIESLNGSLITDEKELSTLHEALVKKCNELGHDYGSEYPFKVWVPKMVKGSYSALSPMDGYDSDYEPDDVDKGSYSHSVHKKCKYCGYVHKRAAIVNYI